MKKYLSIIFAIMIYCSCSGQNNFYLPLAPNYLNASVSYVLGIDNNEKVYYYSDTVFEYENNTWTYNGVLDAYPTDRMYFDSLNIAWFFSGNEVFKMNPGSIPVQVSSNLLTAYPQAYIYGTYMDQNNNLWACGEYQNLNIGFILKFNPLSGSTIDTFPLSGQAINIPHTIRVNKNGDIWILDGYALSGLSSKLYQYKNNNYTSINLTSFGLDTLIASIDVDLSGNLWILGATAGGFSNMALVSFNGSSYTKFVEPISLNSSPVYLLVSNNGDIWISRQGEFYKFDGVNFVSFSSSYFIGYANLIESKKGFLFLNDIDHFYLPVLFNEFGFNSIKGIVFYDINGDGFRQSGEKILTDEEINFQPGNQLTFSDYEGYNLTLPDTSGIYTITCNPPPNWHNSNTPVSYSVFQTYPGQQTSNIDFGFSPDFNYSDAAVYITLNGYTPGRMEYASITIYNYGSVTINDTVTLFLPNGTSFSSACQAPNYVNGNIVKWYTSQILPFEHLTFSFNVYVNPTVAIGSTLHFEVTADPQNGDFTPLNNIISIDKIVTGPFDPNEKTVDYSNPNPNGNIIPGQELLYTVFFQNTGSDTAFNVIIKDTISSFLDLNSLRIIASSHPCTYDLHDSILRFSFNNILLPDSNVNELYSHGYVSYSIKSKLNLNNGDDIFNTAYIYFDYNIPVVTNTTSNNISISSIASSMPNNKIKIFPNPSDDLIILEWTSISNESISIELSDVSGKIISKKNVKSSTGPNHQEIEIASFNVGIYFLAFSNTIQKEIFKIIKN